MHVEPPIQLTKRLAIGVLGRRHLEAFVAYRNDPETAELQDWSIPYALADAEQLVAAGDRAPVFVRGEWTQLAIERRSEPGLVGDVGVHLEDDGSEARIGYTLDPEHRGQGFATEAVLAVVEHLITQLGCQRVIACADPRNDASIRLLGRAGFQPIESDSDGVCFAADEASIGARGDQ